MKNAKTVGANKYFHCVANCQAAKQGYVGDTVANVTSETREQIDERVKGDSRAVCDADRAANSLGRTVTQGQI